MYACYNNVSVCIAGIILDRKEEIVQLTNTLNIFYYVILYDGNILIFFPFLLQVFEHCQQTLALQNRLLSASQNQLTHVKQVTHFMAFLGSLCETMTPAAWKSFMVKAHKLALEHTSMPECQPTPQKVTHRPAAQQCHQPSLHNPPTQKAQQFQQQIEQLQQQLAAIQAQAPPLTALSTPSQVPNLSDLSFASTIFEQHDLSALATPSPHPSSASSEPPTVNEL